MARFVYNKGYDGDYITLEADDGEELPVEVVQAYALTQIGNGLDFVARAINGLTEEVPSLRSIEVDLKK